jgi:hypothetical protein
MPEHAAVLERLETHARIPHRTAARQIDLECMFRRPPRCFHVNTGLVNQWPPAKTQLRIEMPGPDDDVLRTALGHRKVISSKPYRSRWRVLCSNHQWSFVTDQSSRALYTSCLASCLMYKTFGLETRYLQPDAFCRHLPGPHSLSLA